MFEDPQIREDGQLKRIEGSGRRSQCEVRGVIWGQRCVEDSVKRCDAGPLVAERIERAKGNEYFVVLSQRRAGGLGGCRRGGFDQRSRSDDLASIDSTIRIEVCDQRIESIREAPLVDVDAIRSKRREVGIWKADTNRGGVNPLRRGR